MKNNQMMSIFFDSARGGDCVAVKVDNDLMEPEGLTPGAVAIIKYQPEIMEGKMMLFDIAQYMETSEGLYIARAKDKGGMWLVTFSKPGARSLLIPKDQLHTIGRVVAYQKEIKD